MRILSKSITENLDSNLINIIWNFYDEGYQGVIKDDYQFFKIEQNSPTHSILKMWQEVPPSLKTLSIPHYSENEVWIIKEGNLETMLFPSDY